ncbi:hypothetical protein K492DRAFT_61347 [Lichtheimia hyalospora FSU 10163]|nr:hypothetical protein K492DRAFT_61347 [Lichtheimia hyalospora FSU 10163]
MLILWIPLFSLYTHTHTHTHKTFIHSHFVFLSLPLSPSSHRHHMMISLCKLKIQKYKAGTFSNTQWPILNATIHLRSLTELYKTRVPMFV